MAFFICFASCLIPSNADNQQGRGVKCIINYWEGATSLLELILMLLLPLWVMWGVKYFSRDRGAAPQHSFAYQINSRAWWRCQPRQLCYMYAMMHTHVSVKVPLKCIEYVLWYRSLWHSVWGWGGLCAGCKESRGDVANGEHRLQDVTRLISQVNMVIKTNPFTQNIIRNFTQERFHIKLNTVPDHSYCFHVFESCW